MNKKNISSLGMRSDDDWIMDGMWNEPLRVRDMTSHNIWNSIHRNPFPDATFQCGIDREYCELFINGEYRGLYYISERIDNKQQGIYELNGGSLFKTVKQTSLTLFDSITTTYNNESDHWDGYEVKHTNIPDIYHWNDLYNMSRDINVCEKYYIDNSIFETISLFSIMSENKSLLKTVFSVLF